MKRIVVWGWFLCCAPSLLAGQGEVEALDGKRFEGDVHLVNGAVAVAATNQPSSRIELTNLALLRLPSRLHSSPASSTGAIARSSKSAEVPETPPTEVPEPTGPAFPGQGMEPAVAPPPLPVPPAPPVSPAGVLLTGGSFITRQLSSADPSAVRLFVTGREVVVSTREVARIYFQPLPADCVTLIPCGRAGVLLSSEEFVEGEFRGFAQGAITVNSILFGLKSYDPGQVIAVILGDPKPAPARFELKTSDDSLILANSVQLIQDSVRLQDPALGGLAIPLDQVVELRKRLE